MKYRVLVNNRFGEGWKAGDVVDMDYEAARVPLQEKAIEIYREGDIIKEQIDLGDIAGNAVMVEKYYCKECKKEFKSLAGLRNHKRFKHATK